MGNLGFDAVMQLGLGVAWDACVLIGCFVNVFLMDRLGRVNMLVIGGFGCVVLLIIEGVLQKYYLATTFAPGLNAAVAMYFIFGVWFTSTIECTGYVYGAEIWPTHLRSKGATLNYIGFFGPALAYTYPATTAFATIGWKYYMVFVAVTVPCCIAIYFMLPEVSDPQETKRRNRWANPITRLPASRSRRSARCSATTSRSSSRTRCTLIWASPRVPSPWRWARTPSRRRPDSVETMSIWGSLHALGRGGFIKRERERDGRYLMPKGPAKIKPNLST